MSDLSVCDVCGNEGRRRTLKHCPDGWFFGEFPVDDQVVIAVACSAECCARFWHPGPGDLRTGIQDAEGVEVLRSMGVPTFVADERKGESDG